MHADGRTGSQPAYWMSYKVHVPYDADMSHQYCIISIALEAGMRNAFSGIRLIVVKEDSDLGMENIFVKDHGHEISKRTAVPSSDRAILYRQELSQRRHDFGLHHDAPDPRPLCTVVFGIRSIRHTARLFPLRQAPTLPLRIIYERVQFQTSLVAFLFSSTPFNSKQVLGAIHPRVPRPFRHDVRLVPIHEKRSLFPYLPPEIISLITRCAFTEVRTRGWRRDLLSIGLISKAWSHVLDLFFSGLPLVSDTGLSWAERSLASAPAVARCLELRPDRAKLIQSFHTLSYRFKGGRSHSYYTERSRAVLSILRAARSIKRVRLETDIFHHTPTSVTEAISLLQNLRELEDCSINVDKYPGFSLSNLRNALANCTKLDKLKLSLEGNWDFDAANEQDQSVNWPIAVLHLGPGILSPLQFLAFATPRLQNLCLSGLRRISNQHLRTVLLQVSSTLHTLTIAQADSCWRDGEEYAVDAVMPYMQRLTNVDVHGVAGILSLTGKQLSHKIRFPAKLSIAIHDLPSDRIGINSIIRAISITCWDSVRLSLLTNDYRWNPRLKEQAIAKARAKNVDLSFGHCINHCCA